MCLSALVSACAVARSSDSTVTAARALVSCEPQVTARRSPPISPESVSADDPVLLVSRQVPGGLTSVERNHTGHVTLRMVDPTTADTIRRALIALLGSTRSAISREQWAHDLARAEVVRVAWSLAELHDWSRYLSARLFFPAQQAMVGLRGIGADARRVRVVVFIDSDAAREWVEAQLANTGVPCGLVELQRDGPIRVLNRPGRAPPP